MLPILTGTHKNLLAYTQKQLLYITMEISNICIYCASSNKEAEIYGNTTYELGALLAKESITVVTGCKGL